MSVALSRSVLWYADLPGVAESVPLARRYVRDVLVSAGCTRIDDALLLTSELLGNAIRHSDSGREPGGSVSVVVCREVGVVRVEVIDQGSPSSKPEVVVDPNGEGCGGRGLWLVSQIASMWGWHEGVTGQVVWFQLAE
ncbi:ATP-binding protein [Acrocarpospora macrocephala]|uniref:ATP-binding protein n=1 Tax=Acrocarpospora macrocephala TaxID=150177 RepID=UPI001478C472|nr:ATP-binding protein [Acrocarpospora macrocephala]